jgi:hypothetical protein
MTATNKILLKILLRFLSFVLILDIVIKIFPTYPYGSAGQFILIVTELGRIVVLLILVNLGSLFKTRPYSSLSILFLSCIVLGSFARATNFPLFDYIVFSGLIGLSGTYTIHYLGKTHKVTLDLLKLLWVYVFSINAFVFTEHLPYQELSKIAEAVLLLAVYSDFAYNKLRSHHS